MPVVILGSFSFLFNEVLPLSSSAVERQKALTPKLLYLGNWHLWNQETETTVTIVMGYAYVVITPRSEQADLMNSTLRNEPSNAYHKFSQNKDFGVDALCLSTAQLSCGKSVKGKGMSGFSTSIGL